jgi:hypothetical protein
MKATVKHSMCSKTIQGLEETRLVGYANYLCKPCANQLNQQVIKNITKKYL